MQITQYAGMIDNLMPILKTKYGLHYSRATPHFWDAKAFKEQVINTISTLFPLDKLEYIREHICAKSGKYEIFVLFNDQEFIFHTNTQENFIDYSFFEIIYDLPNYSKFKYSVRSVNWDAGITNDEIFFTSGEKEKLEAAILEGLPVGEERSYWQEDFNKQRIGKEKRSYLTIQSDFKNITEDELKSLFIKGANFFARKHKIPFYLPAQIYLINHIKIETALPHTNAIDYNAYLNIFINGESTTIFTLITDSHLFFPGYTGDHIWANSIAKKYGGVITLTPYLENKSSKTITFTPSEYTSWLEQKMEQSPSIQKEI